MVLIDKNYDIKEVIELIGIIKKSIIKNRFTISLDGNKIENLQFIGNYNVKQDRIIDILYNLKEEDFCYGIKDINNQNSDEHSYVFCPKIYLYDIEGKLELVCVYLRFKIVKYSIQDNGIVVSIHERKKPMSYLFQ